MARNSGLPGWLLVVGGLLMADKVLGIFSDANDPGSRPYPNPGGAPRVLTDAQLRGYADSIEAALYGFWNWTEDEAEVVRILSGIPTDQDMVALVNVYGTRGTALLPSITLPAAVSAYLSPSDISTINAALSARGMQFRF